MSATKKIRTYLNIYKESSTHVCPPENFDGAHLACHVVGFDQSLVQFCGENDCGGNATCFNGIQEVTCECNDGFVGDGQVCTAWTAVDECALGLSQ